MPRIIAILGKIGCGKSTVANLCKMQAHAAGKQVALLDADQLVQHWYQDPAFMATLQARCGPVFGKKQVEKAKALAQMQQNTAHWHALEALIGEWFDAALHTAKSNAAHDIVLLDAPTLYKRGAQLQQMVSGVLLVDAPRNMREARAVTRMQDTRHLSATEAAARFALMDAAQPEMAEFEAMLAAANIPYHVIENHSTLDALATQIAAYMQIFI